ncbi:MAG: translocation/assembly module TamB domain-containing protein [Nitrospirae bacterium]|nr:translocation/assembly module TamB domain-containing protein [Nitrospirota bacterium]
MEKRKKRWLLAALCIIISMGILSSLLRGPTLSNSIKRLILPHLEEATGEKVIMDKAVINLFPMYLQTKGLKVFDKDGKKLLEIARIRAYIELSGLFFKELRIRRLVLREPDLTADKEDLERVINSITSYLSEQEDKYIKVVLKNASITQGKLALSDKKTQAIFTASGLNSEILKKETVNIKLSVSDSLIKASGLPEFRGKIKCSLKTDGRRFEISDLGIYLSDSSIETKGEIMPFAADSSKAGSLSGKAKILSSTIGKFFKLKKERDGEITLHGAVDLITEKTEHRTQSTDNRQRILENDTSALKPLKFSLDLKVKGWFHLETLMEIVKVEENIYGRISLDGNIKGIYPDILGEADVTLKDAMLSTLPLNELAGKMKYRNNIFSLDNFIAHTFEGAMKGKAHVSIPHGDYAVTADVISINSPEFFKFIEWEPPFPKGKVSGNFILNKIHGGEFDVTATASYINTSKEGQELKDRLKTIKSDMRMKEGSIAIKNTRLATNESEIILDGDINLNEKRLNLALDLKSPNSVDLAMPYFDGLKAPVRLKGKAIGSSLKPEISGILSIGPGTINGVEFAEASGGLEYNVKSLTLKSFLIKEQKAAYEVSGNIIFRKATELFAFTDPYYEATAIIKSGKIDSLITAAYPSYQKEKEKEKKKATSSRMPLAGIVDGRLSFKGDHKEFKGEGEFTVNNGTAFNQKIERSLIKAVLSPQKIDFPLVNIHNGETNLSAKGSVYFDGAFDAVLTSANARLQDITYFANSPLEAQFSADIRGSGTFKKPDIKFSLNISDSSLKGAKIGSGSVSGELKEKGFSAKGSFVNGLVTASAKGTISKPFSWDMRTTLKRGSYDFFLSNFMKEPPKDLSVFLEGVVDMKGVKDKISMDSRFNFVSLSLYGQTLRNHADVILRLSEKTFTIDSFFLTGKDADLLASGRVNIGKDYNLALKGKLDMSAVKPLSKAIESVDGLGSFNMGISGRWGKPEFNGKINIKDGSAMITGFPYRIRSINGNVSLDKDRFVLDSIDAVFANGNVRVSGSGYMKAFNINRLSVYSTLKDIKLRHIAGVDIIFDGKLFYDFSQKGKSFTGDVYIKKAKYEKRIEWKSGLLAIKEVKKAEIKQPSFWSDTKLNIRVTGGESLFVDNNIAKAPLKVDLTVTGTVSQYGLIGRVETREGKIFFRGNEFDIVSASADFIEPQRITPVFNIQANTFTKGYRINLGLDGPVDKFTLSVSSDPALSDTDIFTLLTAGQISKGPKGFEGGIGAGEATAFLTGKLQDVMEERFKHITGLERFEIDPGTTATGSISPKVTVGKRLIGDKLFATYSTSIGATEEQLIKLEYLLNKNTSLVGSRDEKGSVGADIKFRFEFK